MALRVMQKEALPKLVEALMVDQKVIGPKRVRKGAELDQFVFDEIKSPDQLALDYPTTVLPPKHWLLPSDERLFRFKLGPQPEITPAEAGEPVVFFGLHPCDIAGIKCLDEVMEEGNPDPLYLARRAQATIIGTEISPLEYCYASFVGNAMPTDGYDLFLTDIGDDIVVDVATEKGKAVIEKAQTRDATAEDIAAVDAVRAKIAEGSEGCMGDADVRAMPLVMTKAADSEVWEEAAAACFRCGTCNLVCPTCYCFNVEDVMDPSLETGARVRSWDACMLDRFAAVAGGENFREEPKDRLIHRVNRKFHYQYTKFGHPHCTGCGRCVRSCVASINQFDAIKDLLAEQAEGVTHGS